MKGLGFRSWFLAATAVLTVGIMIAIPLTTVAQGAGDGAATMEGLKATSRQSIEWWNSNAQVDPDRLFAPGYTNHQEPIAASDDEQGVTLDELKAIVASYHGAFPGTKVQIQMQVVESNRVATHWTFSGTQKGTYEGLTPTDKTVSWAGISIDEYDADGKIKETWVVWDKYTLFRKLGLIE